jgi:hypothetical protein
LCKICNDDCDVIEFTVMHQTAVAGW